MVIKLFLGSELVGTPSCSMKPPTSNEQNKKEIIHLPTSDIVHIIGSILKYDTDLKHFKAPVVNHACVSLLEFPMWCHLGS